MPKLHIIRDTLSDNSEGFGVRLSMEGVYIDFDCMGERNAESLAAALADAFNVHGQECRIVQEEIKKSCGW